MNNKRKDKQSNEPVTGIPKLDSLPWVPAKSSIDALAKARAYQAKLEEE